MKYKVGDKVRIKTWKELEKEFGVNKNGNIGGFNKKCLFVSKKEEYLNKNFPDRILTIKGLNELGDKFGYIVKEIDNQNWLWTDKMIKEKVAYEPILSRFDILDIR